MDNKKILSVVLIIFLISGIIFFYENIFISAKRSVDSVCFPDESVNGRILGETKVAEGEIIVNIFEDDEDLSTLKHELTHVHQLNRKLSFRFGCEGRGIIGFYLAEMEAYSAERLPNEVWEFIYNYELDSF